MVTTHAPNLKDESIVILRPKGIGKVSLVKSQTDPPTKKRRYKNTEVAVSPMVPLTKRSHMQMETPNYGLV